MARQETGGDTILNSIILLLVGSAAGMALGLLVAPKSGKRTRRDLRRAGYNLTREAQDFADDLRERLDDLAYHSHELIERGTGAGDEIRNKIRNDLVPNLQAAKDLIDRQIERARRTVE